MSFFGKNIRKIRSVKALSQQAFAELFDLKRGTLGAYEEGRSEPKIETIIKIANHFSIPIDDLLTKEITVNKLLKFKGNLITDPEESGKEQFATVPCVVQSNRNEYLGLFDKQGFIRNMPSLSLPINKEIKYRGYTVENLEMSNHDKGLFPKDVVIGEVIPKSDFKKLDNGILVVVLLKDTLLLRRLYITDKTFVLRADHKVVEDIQVAMEEVRELWHICYVFYHRVPDSSDGLEEKMKQLEQEFVKLRTQIL